jgi:diaminopimelate decarboxylase
VALDVSRLDARACLRVSRQAGTPCFVLFPDLLRQLAETVGSARRLNSRLRLAYPIKTMPLAYWLRAWRKLGRYAEASSECELQLALKCGFSTKRIIVSGPGKNAWMGAQRLRHLSVVFDSVAEAEALGAVAVRSDWRVGLRFAPKHQVDPDNIGHPDQFGIDVNHWRRTLDVLQGLGVKVAMLQFHLGGWQGDVESRLKTLQELADLARHGGLEPEVIDVGGGLPQAYRAEDAISTARRAAANLKRLEREACRLFPSCREVVAECGRVILGPTAVLLLRVVDVKVKYGKRFIICDGGRVNHALPSDWEEHQVYFPNSTGSSSRAEATVCGPTCMAWDFISRAHVPVDVQPGHFVVYDAAGAYHWPWQSCFSQRRAAVAAVRKLPHGDIRVRRLIDSQGGKDWLALSGA